MGRKSILFILLIVLLAGCKQRYYPNSYHQEDPAKATQVTQSNSRKSNSSPPASKIKVLEMICEDSRHHQVRVTARFGEWLKGYDNKAVDRDLNFFADYPSFSDLELKESVIGNVLLGDVEYKLMDQNVDLKQFDTSDMHLSITVTQNTFLRGGVVFYKEMKKYDLDDSKIEINPLLKKTNWGPVGILIKTGPYAVDYAEINVASNLKILEAKVDGIYQSVHSNSVTVGIRSKE